MLSPKEALHLEIKIAQLASRYAAARDPTQRSQLLSSIRSLTERREQAGANRTTRQFDARPIEARHDEVDA